MESYSTTSNVEKDLLNLGDPSGRKDRKYWDDWFDIVCRRQNHRSFEWYCSSNEVLQVVKYHLFALSSEGEDARMENNEYSMIHPGSGTSLVPVLLKNTFPMSRQVVVDISTVAISEMKSIHDEQRQQSNLQLNVPQRPIEYVITDLLNSRNQEESLNSESLFPESIFDCWIDKGFVDAIFSDANVTENTNQSSFLFTEANRVLKPGTGFAVVVSLAEEHSLQIILENWLTTEWQSVIHIWELEPSTGELPPFAFVLTKVGRNQGPVDRNMGRLLFFHRVNNGSIDKIEMFDENVVQKSIREMISTSRERFRSSNANKSDIHTILALIEIKPCDADVDLLEVGTRIREERWATYCDGDSRRPLRPIWQPFSSHEDVEWCKVVPIGFGISKLQLQCVIQSEDLDDLIAQIEEWDSDAVQSVDIDWSKTVPIGNFDNLIVNHTHEKWIVSKQAT
jgi:translation elongation factor EF-1beta